MIQYLPEELLSSIFSYLRPEWVMCCSRFYRYLAFRQHRVYYLKCQWLEVRQHEHRIRYDLLRLHGYPIDSVPYPNRYRIGEWMRTRLRYEEDLFVLRNSLQWWQKRNDRLSHVLRQEYGIHNLEEQFRRMYYRHNQIFMI